MSTSTLKSEQARLTDQDRELILATQEGLPLVSDPWGELGRQLGIAHGMAAIFDDHGFAVIALHEGQGLRQNMGLCYPVIRRCRFFCPVFYFGF